jgi:hypothetical protein
MGPKKRASCESQKLEGRYANYFKIGHNAFEFVIDFGQSYSGNDETELCARIVTCPVYAKAFLKALQDSIETFEATYGSISAEELENYEY